MNSHELPGDEANGQSLSPKDSLELFAIGMLGGMAGSSIAIGAAHGAHELGYGYGNPNVYVSSVLLAGSGILCGLTEVRKARKET